MNRLASLHSARIGIVTFALGSVGCYGAARVSYVDSSRTAGAQTSDESLVDQVSPICGSSGPASVTTYASIGDRLIRIFTAQISQPRHIEMVCAKKED